jgi:hypothetical protein
MLSRLMSDRDQSGVGGCAPQISNSGALILATQPARPPIQHPFAGNPGSKGLRSGLFSIEQGPYPLRT